MTFRISVYMIYNVAAGRGERPYKDGRLIKHVGITASTASEGWAEMMRLQTVAATSGGHCAVFEIRAYDAPAFIRNPLNTQPLAQWRPVEAGDAIPNRAQFCDALEIGQLFDLAG